MHDGTTFEMVVHHKLPCGHMLEHACTYEKDTTLDIRKQYETASAVLEFWLHDRVSRHRCELVSPANPSGSAPKVSHAR